MSARGEPDPPMPEPVVEGCDFDNGFAPPLAVMRLQWPSPVVARSWSLPEQVVFRGAPPQRFGLRLQRRDFDSYSLCLLWDGCHVLWPALTRTQLLATDLTPLLAALGTDLAYLLDQEIHVGPLSVRLAEVGDAA